MYSNQRELSDHRKNLEKVIFYAYDSTSIWYFLESSRGLLFRKAQATLGLRICMSDMVKCPPGEDLNEWIAVHAVDFFNRISLIYGTLTDNCNATTCPSMTHTYGSKVRDLFDDLI